MNEMSKPKFPPSERRVVRTRGVDHLALGHLVAAHEIQFELAKAGGDEVTEVADPRHRGSLADSNGALPGVGDHRAVVGDAEPSADAGVLVDVAALTRRDAHLLDDLLHERRHEHGERAVEVHRGLLPHDLDPEFALARVVRLNRRPDAVLELGDDLARAVVRHRVGRKQDQHVDVESDGIAADLYVALLENVEQSDLNELIEIGQLVHGEYAAVHTRDQSEV